MAADQIRSGLFPPDFLNNAESVSVLGEWAELTNETVDGYEERLRGIFKKVSPEWSPNESVTEDELIWPVLRELGWMSVLRQVNASAVGRHDIPDGIMYLDDKAKSRAMGVADARAQYAIGTVLVEAKKWRRPLDRRSSGDLAPSTQIHRYLNRVGEVRWGILTNGSHWRLYYQGARSISDDFLEIDLPTALGMREPAEDLFALSESDRRHLLRLFVLLFRRNAFLSEGPNGLTVHERALKEGRHYEQRVADNISALVFDDVFPRLVVAIAKATAETPLPEVRDAALVVLYRLLFVLYAEDRALLPVHDREYANIGLRRRVREDIGRRKDHGETFSATATGYWNALQDLCRIIDGGDPAFGLPPYNGGLFLEERTPILRGVRLSNSDMAEIIDALSFEKTDAGRRYINYGNLSVQQLGSIYERLLEFEVARVGGEIVVRPNVFARKGSGSFYTPEPLVELILKETIDPLVNAKLDAFRQASNTDKEKHDAAEAILDLKVCDPAMGSGHFLVSLVDRLTDHVMGALAESHRLVAGYASPLVERIDAIRRTIQANAGAKGWTVDPVRLDDRRIVRRMVLKRCVYGVDKNPMAVELAKVSLWLHSFTVGAPLSFLDHHLRCGDSLFGFWVRDAMDRVYARAGQMFAVPLDEAMGAADPMGVIEELPDAEIAEAERSSELFAGIRSGIEPLDSLLSVVYAADWLQLDRSDQDVVDRWLAGGFGDPIAIAMGKTEPASEDDTDGLRRLAKIIDSAGQLVQQERFLHWQVEFPGVWSKWGDKERRGGFDAVIGNPPWERMKLQQVEWFAVRRPEIASVQRASDRKRMIRELDEAEDPLATEFQRASNRAAAALDMARGCGNYPRLSKGDVNLYSLFVERAFDLVNPNGLVGLLTPSGVALDKTAAPFFRSVATEGRLRALYDFENRKVFFPDVHASFKFSVFVGARASTSKRARCAFYIHDVRELDDDQRCFPLAADDFARVNPNTGTAPIFRSRRDAELTTAIYERLPVLVDRSGVVEDRAWPVKYTSMFHMTNDSGLFRTREELEEQIGAWRTNGNLFDSPDGLWLPLYEGKMVQAFDHRAASVVVNLNNRHRPAKALAATPEERMDPNWSPEPRFWVSASDCSWANGETWVLGFKEITAATNARTMIAALFPTVGFGNKVPILRSENETSLRDGWLLAANLNSTILDYVARQKLPGQTLNLFVVEQLPIVPWRAYGNSRFGPKSASEVVQEAVLELTYTGWDMAPFAIALGHTDDEGEPKAPFCWDAERRLCLRAKLDAVYFHLYGVTDREDVRHIYSTFPIVERLENALYGRYRSRDLCLAWMNALAAGKPDADVSA